MSRARRTKRASVQDLYTSCKLGGDCPEDVKNKVENTTLADRLLQILGSVVYFGQLGIGSGKGTGGITGYRPLQNTPRVGTNRPIESIRPNIPIDPLGGSDIIPPTVIDATAPSVVPLTETGTPEVNIISSGTGTNIELGELDIITNVDPTSTAVGTAEHPAVIDVTDEGTSVIDVQSGPPPPKRLQIDSSLKPYEHIELTVYPPYNQSDPNVNVFVDTHFGGDPVGVDYTSFSDVNLREEFEIEQNIPRSSTPANKNIATKAKDLYQRFTLQVPTQSLGAVARPSRQVTFQFENPAFSEDVTMAFNQDVEEVTAAPNEQFRDIQTLSRPRFSETESGHVRLSRIGQKASMKTRSGLIIGERVHYFYDISDITVGENIELPTISSSVQTSGESIIQDSQIDGIVLDENLLDDFAEDFSNAHLIFTTTDEFNESVDIIGIPPEFGLKTFIPQYTNNSLDSSQISMPVLPLSIPSAPLYPAAVIIFGEDYIIDPYYLRRKRKRVDFY
ncbi:L2 [Gammapapillomavirus 13]|uniref:Minor capsid protein L2 n=1 Tax=Gammapapillomavirus 13 TaxID=1513258 RepID=A0A2D2ALR4_9PAPI|nr:L2 [Gammapapillomavirus 13]